MEAQRYRKKPHHRSNKRANPAYGRRAWQEARQLTLERDGYVCQVQSHLCVGVATTCDHIVSLAEGGHPYDLANLRAACKPCNSHLGGLVGKRLNDTRRAHSRQW